MLGLPRLLRYPGADASILEPIQVCQPGRVDWHKENAMRVSGGGYLHTGTKAMYNG